MVKSLLVKGFGIVNHRTDTYLILNVQSCGRQLEPSLDLMAPGVVCLVMQTLYKSTLNEACRSNEAVSPSSCYSFAWQNFGIPCNPSCGIQTPSLDDRIYMSVRTTARSCQQNDCHGLHKVSRTARTARFTTLLLTQSQITAPILGSLLLPGAYSSAYFTNEASL